MVSASTVALTPEGMRQLYDDLLMLSERREALTTSVDGLVDREAGSNFHSDLTLLNRRIAEIQSVLARAVPLDDADRVPGVVGIGSRVTVQWGDIPDDTEAYTIVEPEEVAPREGRISYESPVGQALIGRAIGNQITVATADGDARLTIVAVE